MVRTTSPEAKKSTATSPAPVSVSAALVVAAATGIPARKGEGEGEGIRERGARVGETTPPAGVRRPWEAFSVGTAVWRRATGPLPSRMSVRNRLASLGFHSGRQPPVSRVLCFVLFGHRDARWISKGGTVCVEWERGCDSCKCNDKKMFLTSAFCLALISFCTSQSCPPC